jgi:hypothetical protein
LRANASVSHPFPPSLKSLAHPAIVSLQSFLANETYYFMLEHQIHDLKPSNI